MIKEISAITGERVGIDPIQTAQQQVIRVHQIITNCWKMTCQSHTHTHTHHSLHDHTPYIYSHLHTSFIMLVRKTNNSNIYNFSAV